jgi:hypothetical protein
MRNRQKETLFIDARKLGTLVDRVHRELSDDDIAKIADTYHRWRGDGAGKYEDVAGFCKSATTEEIASHQFVLTPGRYVGAEEVEDDGEPFDEKMKRLVATLEEQFAEGARLEKEIRKNLRGLWVMGGLAAQSPNAMVRSRLEYGKALRGSWASIPCSSEASLTTTPCLREQWATRNGHRLDDRFPLVQFWPRRSSYSRDGLQGCIPRGHQYHRARVASGPFFVINQRCLLCSPEDGDVDPLACTMQSKTFKNLHHKLGEIDDGSPSRRRTRRGRVCSRLRGAPR